MQALGNVVTDAEFNTVDEHEAAFWTALVSGLDSALGHMEVHLGAPVDQSAFEPRRVRIQGQASGYGRARWTVETIDLPTEIDFEALDADYVLFVDDAIAVTDLDGQTLSLPIGRVLATVTLPTKGINAGGRMVLVQSGSPTPILAHRIWAGEDGGGILDNRLSRDVWDRAMSKLAASVAAAAEGR